MTPFYSGIRGLSRSGAGDFFLSGQTEATEVAQWVMEVVVSRIPARFSLDPLRGVIGLSPMRRGEAGVGALNEKLQAALNPPAGMKPKGPSAAGFSASATG